MQCILCVPHSLICPFSSFFLSGWPIWKCLFIFTLVCRGKKGKGIEAFLLHFDPMCVLLSEMEYSSGLCILYFCVCSLFPFHSSPLDGVAADQVRKFRPVADLSVPSGIRKVRPINRRKNRRTTHTDSRKRNVVGCFA